MIISGFIATLHKYNLQQIKLLERELETERERKEVAWEYINVLEERVGVLEEELGLAEQDLDQARYWASKIYKERIKN